MQHMETHPLAHLYPGVPVRWNPDTDVVEIHLVFFFGFLAVFTVESRNYIYVENVFCPYDIIL